MKKADMAICICSCDAYSDVWPLFFHFFKKAWPDCKYPIYLNTESLNYQDSELSVQCLHCTEKCSWSERLMKALKNIPSDEVLLILDDFFILSPVDTAAIDGCVRNLKDYPKIACFNFRDMNVDGETEDGRFKGFRKRIAKNTFWVNYLPAIWNKKALLAVLSPYEDPWQSEIFGTFRAKLLKWDYYESMQNCKVIDFNMDPNDGYGIVHGKWTQKTVGLFNDNGLQVDFSKRGVCEGFYDYSTERIDPPKRTFKDVFAYLRFGGLPYGSYYHGKKRLTFFDCLSLAVKSPKLLFHVFVNKLQYLFGKNPFFSDQGK